MARIYEESLETSLWCDTVLEFQETINIIRISVQIIEMLALFVWFPIIMVDVIWESQPSSTTAFTHSICGFGDSPPIL